MRLSRIKSSLIKLLAMTGFAALSLLIAAQAMFADETRLGPGDTISVSVLNRTELGGVFTIPEDGRIHLFVVGEVPAAGRTPVEIREELQRELSESDNLPVSVRVTVEAWRPVYVLGDVNTQGAYPYRPGMTVQHVLALAGGYLRTATGGSDGLEIRLTDEAAKMRVLELQLDQLLAVQGRLLLEEVEALELPPEMADFGEEIPDEYLAEQLEILNLRKESMAMRAAAAEIEIDRGQAEVAASVEQQSILNERIADHEARVAEITARWSGVSERLRDVVASLNDDRIASLLARTQEIHARAAIDGARTAIEQVQIDRRRDAVEGLAENAAAIRETKVALASSRAFIQRFQGMSGPWSGGLAAPTPKFSVSRQVGQTIEQLDLQLTDRLQPGDALQITLIPSEENK